MIWMMHPPKHAPWLKGFGSDKEYEAYAGQRERQQRRREEREKWEFDGLPTEEEQAAAQIRVERRWVCVVEGHDWQTVDRWPEQGCQVQQCYRCHNVRLIKEPAVSREPGEKGGDTETPLARGLGESR